MTTTANRSEGLRHYLDIVRKHKRIAIAATIIVPLAAFLFSVRQAPEYQATAEVLLSGENFPADLGGVPNTTGQQFPERDVETQAGLARSPAVVERTLKAANRRDLSIDALLASSSVTPKTNSDFLEFSVVSNNAVAAARLATEYARQFTRYRLELDTTPTRRAREQLQRRIQQLRHNGETDSALYSNLLSKEQELATFEALQTSKTFLVHEARGAIQVQPRTRRNTVLGLMLGVLLALGLVAIAHALDTRVWSVGELEARLGLPLLSRVSPSPAGANGSLVMRTAPSHADAEAYRLLRANFDFMNRERDARVIMITSASEGEGKSRIAANLSITYAREGKHVILVDLDLRRPALARLLDIPRKPGLIEAVLDGREVSDVLNSVRADDAGMTRLGVIPAGGGAEDIVAHAHRNDVPVSAPQTSRWKPAQARPAARPLQTLAVGEVLTSTRLRTFLKELTEQADLVFVDGPALLGTGDAITLGSVVDAIVLVTEEGRLRQDTVDNVTRALSSCPAPTLGWVVTGTSAIAGEGVFASVNGRKWPGS
jgi:Mrp family chromosome partitioning ATPase/capsular polysaccharide biosynthesis protein